MISTEFLSELDRFSFSARKRVSGLYTGARRSPKIGRGTDAYGFREYEKGDDFRTIDWKVYARSEKLYVRQFEEYRDMTTHILLDASASMDYPAGPLRKFDYAAMLAVGFAYLAMRENEKFTVSTFAEDIDISKPGRGRGHLLEIIDRLNSLVLQGKTGIENSLQHYAAMIKSKSRVIVISDLLRPLDDIRPAIYRMGRHDLIVIQVLDPSEIELSVIGPARLHDMETSEQLFTDFNTAMVSDYKNELKSHIEDIKAECDRLDADFFTIRTDMPVFEAIYRIIHGR